MTRDDRARTELHHALDTAVGDDNADTLMSYLPPVGWADVATRHDLDTTVALLRAELHTEIAGLRDQLHTEIAGVRDQLHTEIAGLRHELHTEIAGLHTEIAGLRHEMADRFGAVDQRLEEQGTHLERALRSQTRWLLSAIVAVAGALLAAAQLLG